MHFINGFARAISHKNNPEVPRNRIEDVLLTGHRARWVCVIVNGVCIGWDVLDHLLLKTNKFEFVLPCGVRTPSMRGNRDMQRAVRRRDARGQPFRGVVFISQANVSLRHGSPILGASYWEE